MDSRNTIVRLDARDPDVIGKYQHGEQILILCDASAIGFTTVVPPADIAENTELVYQNTAPDGGGDVTLTLSRPTDVFDNNGETSIVLGPSQSVTLRCDMLGKWLSTGRDTHGGGVTGTGVAGTIPIWTAESVLGSSAITDLEIPDWSAYAITQLSATGAVRTLHQSDSGSLYATVFGSSYVGMFSYGVPLATASHLYSTGSRLVIESDGVSPIDFAVNGSLVQRITSTGVEIPYGNVGIGSSEDASYRLKVSGSAFVTGSISFGASAACVMSESSGNITLSVAGSDKDLYISANDGGSTKTFFFVDASEALLYLGSTATGTDRLKIEADGTWVNEGGSVTYDDVQFAIVSGNVPAANAPTLEAFTTNTKQYSFAVNDYIDIAANEPFHGWKEESAADIHLHVATKAANNSGANQYAKFTIYIAYATPDSAYTETSLSAEVTFPTGTVALYHKYLDMGDLTLTGYKIGTQIAITVKRIAATGGTEYPGNVFITQCGAHLVKDMNGSRNETTK